MRPAYFARAVDGLEKNEVATCRKAAVDALASVGYEVINDFTYDYRGAEDLVESQIANIQRSEILVADMSIPYHPYIGTIGEIIYAHQMGKKVYVIFGGYGHLKERPWLAYHVDGFFEKMEDVIGFLGSDRTS